MKDRSRRPRWTRRRAIAAALLALLVPPLGYFGARIATGNFGVVEPARVYRAAQLTGPQITAAIRDRGIRTVLNLRGRNPDTPWYRDEMRATLAEGTTHVDMSMASDQWLTRTQARVLLSTLESCEYPILIHCQFGAERTGLVSAYSVLLRPGGTLAEARAQFSPLYMFLPIRDGAIMLAQLQAYERWLAAEQLAHEPDHFRRWLGSEYRPEWPSREYWPYDPYPTRVVVWPEGKGPMAAGATRAAKATGPAQDSLRIR